MADFDQNTYQPISGDMYILEIRSGRFIIHRHDGRICQQLGAGHSKGDIQALIAPMQFLGKSKGKKRYSRPTRTQGWLPTPGQSATNVRRTNWRPSMKLIRPRGQM